MGKLKIVSEENVNKAANEPVRARATTGTNNKLQVVEEQPLNELPQKKNESSAPESTSSENPEASTSTSTGNTATAPSSGLSGVYLTDVHNFITTPQTARIGGKDVDLSTIPAAPLPMNPELQRQAQAEMLKRIQERNISDEDADKLAKATGMSAADVKRSISSPVADKLAKATGMSAADVKRSISSPVAYDLNRASNVLTSDVDANLTAMAPIFQQMGIDAAKMKEQIMSGDGKELSKYYTSRSAAINAELQDIQTKIARNQTYMPGPMPGTPGVTMYTDPNLQKELEDRRTALEGRLNDLSDASKKMLAVQVNKQFDTPDKQKQVRDFDLKAAEEIGSIYKKTFNQIAANNDEKRLNSGFILSDQANFENARAGYESRLITLAGQLDDARQKLKTDKSESAKVNYDQLVDKYNKIIEAYPSLSDNYPEVRREELTQGILEAYNKKVQANRAVNSAGGVPGQPSWGDVKNVVSYLFASRPDDGDWDSLSKETGLSVEELKKIDKEEKGFKTGAIRVDGLLGTVATSLYGGLRKFEKTGRRIFGDGTDVQKDIVSDEIDKDIQNTMRTPSDQDLFERPVTIDLNKYDKEGKINPNFLRQRINEDMGKFNANPGSFIHTIGDTGAQVALFSIGGQAVGSIVKAAGGELAAMNLASNEMNAFNNTFRLADATQRLERAGEIAGTFGSSFAMGYDDYYKAASEYTNDVNKRHLSAAVNSAIDGLTEIILPEVDITRAMKGEKSLFKIFDNTLKENGGLWTGNAFKQYTAAVGKTLEVAGMEGAEEILGAIGQNLADNMILDKKNTAQDVVNDAKQSFVSAFIGTIPMAVGAGLGSTSRLKKESMFEAGSSPNRYIAYTQDLLSKGKISQAEADKRIKTISTMADIVKGIPQTDAQGNAYSLDHKVEIAAQEYRIRSNKNLAANSPIDSVKQQATEDLAEAQQTQQDAIANTPVYRVNGKDVTKEEVEALLKDDAYKQHEIHVANDPKLQDKIKKLDGRDYDVTDNNVSVTTSPIKNAKYENVTTEKQADGEGESGQYTGAENPTEEQANTEGEKPAVLATEPPAPEPEKGASTGKSAPVSPAIKNAKEALSDREDAFGDKEDLTALFPESLKPKVTPDENVDANISTEERPGKKDEPKKNEKPQSKKQDAGVSYEKLSNINTDTERFQPRAADFSQQSVDNIVSNFDDNKLDPIVLYKDKDGKDYVLSGHSRLEAHKQLTEMSDADPRKMAAMDAGFQPGQIKARYFTGTEEEARQFAERSNDLATKNNDFESAASVRRMRDEGRTKKEIQADAKGRFGKNWRYINNLSYLNENGPVIGALQQFESSNDKDMRNRVEKIAQWIGAARERLGDRLTNAHEQELFNYLNDPKNQKKFARENDFLGYLENITGRFDYNSNDPLNVNKLTTKSQAETQYETELREIDNEIKQREKDIKELRDRFNNPNNEQFINPNSQDYAEVRKIADAKEKQMQDELQALRKEKMAHMSDRKKYVTAAQQQTSLFNPSNLAPEEITQLNEMLADDGIDLKDLEEYEASNRHTDGETVSDDRGIREQREHSQQQAGNLQETVREPNNDTGANTQQDIGRNGDQASVQETVSDTNAGDTGASNIGADDPIKQKLADKRKAFMDALKKSRGQLNVGIDPDVIIAGVDLLASYAEAGIKKFADLVRDMIDGMGKEFFQDKSNVDALKGVYAYRRSNLPRQERKDYDNEDTIDDFIDNELPSLIEGIPAEAPPVAASIENTNTPIAPAKEFDTNNFKVPLTEAEAADMNKAIDLLDRIKEKGPFSDNTNHIRSYFNTHVQMEGLQTGKNPNGSKVNKNENISRIRAELPILEEAAQIPNTNDTSTTDDLEQDSIRGAAENQLSNLVNGNMKGDTPAPRLSELIKRLKIKPGGALNSMILPIPQLWNATVDIVSNLVKAGETLTDALRKGMDHIRREMKEDFHKQDMSTYNSEMVAALRSNGTLKYNLTPNQQAQADKVIARLTKGARLINEVMRLRDRYNTARQALLQKQNVTPQEIDQFDANYKEFEQYILDGVVAQDMAKSNQISLDVPQQSWLERQEENWLDYLQRLGKYQKAIDEKGITIDEQNDMMNRADRWRSIAEAKADGILSKIGMGKSDLLFWKGQIKVKDSLFDRMNKAGVDWRKFNLYLYALHAPERNAHNAKIRRERFMAKLTHLQHEAEYAEMAHDQNPSTANKAYLTRKKADLEEYEQYMSNYDDPNGNKQIMRLLEQKIPERYHLMNDGGSGMTNKQAAEIIDEAKKDPELYQKYEDFEQELRTDLFDKILDLQVEYGFKNKDEADYMRDYYSKWVPLRVEETYFEQDGKKPGIKSVTGHEIYSSKGADYITFEDRNNPITQAIIQLQGTIHDGEQNKYRQTIAAGIRSAPDGKVWEIAPALYEAVKDKQGRVLELREITQPKGAIPFKEDGEKKYLVIHDQQLSDAIQGNNLKNGVAWLAKINSYWRTLHTAANPEFIVSNVVRDLQTAGTVLSGTQKKAFRKAFRKGSIVSVMRAMRGSFREDGNKLDTPTNDKWQQLAKEYKEAGGNMSWFRPEPTEEMIKDVQDAYEKYQKNNSWENGKQLGMRMVDAFERAAQAFETSTRLKVYEAALSAGLEKHKAVEAARNATVNFNRKGNFSGLASNLYLFFNANVQGTANMFRSLLTTRQGLVMAGKIALVGFMQSLWNNWMSDCKENPANCYDNVRDYDKDRNIIIRIPGVKGFIKIPLAYGVNTFYNFGENVGQLTLGKIGAVDATKNTMLSVLNNFNPMGNVDSPVLQQIAPTFLDPIVQWFTNQDAFGRPIYKQERFDHRPDSQQTMTGNSELSKQFAAFLNRISSGNEKTKGKIDVSPGTIDWMLNTATGGLGQFLKRAMITGTGNMKGDYSNVDVKDMPILNRFYMQPKENINTSMLWKRLNDSYNTEFSQKEVDEWSSEMDRSVKAGLKDKEKAEKDKLTFFRNQFEQGEVAGNILEKAKEQALTPEDYKNFREAVKQYIDQGRFTHKQMGTYMQRLQDYQRDWRKAKKK